MSVPVISNFNYTVQQNFLQKIYIFSWNAISPPPSTNVYYDIYINNKFNVRTINNTIKISSGVGCVKSCVKIKTIYEDTNLNTFSESAFSEELCFVSPPDRYCNLPINLWQSENISDEEKKKYQDKLENLKTNKKSSKLRYSQAIRNKSSSSSFSSNSMLRFMMYSECIP
tara:strand:+ start:4493 stop:5002 length:510 start_codon:yes stop_codon:yes gene_type:complete